MLLCMIGLFILELKVFENMQCNVKKNNMLNVKIVIIIIIIIIKIIMLNAQNLQ